MHRPVEAGKKIKNNTGKNACATQSIELIANCGTGILACVALKPIFSHRLVPMWIMAIMLRTAAHLQMSEKADGPAFF